MKIALRAFGGDIYRQRNHRSADIRFRRLQGQRLFYLLALGQPNPEDFIASLKREGASKRRKPLLRDLPALSRDRTDSDGKLMHAAATNASR